MKKRLAVILATLMCVVVLAGCSSKKISVDMEPYISVSYKGYNGNGTAVFDFNYADFEYEIMSQWKDDDKSFEKLAELTALEMTINCDPETVDGLKNGDTITVTMTCDEEKAKELGYSFSGMSKTFTVEGLTDAIEIDPFDESIFGEDKPVYFKMGGISPFITIDLSNRASWDDPDPIRSIKYGCDQIYSFLQNGDVITITASLPDNVDTQGYVLTRTELTITAEGFDACVSEASQLTSAFLQSASEQAYQKCVADANVSVLTPDSNFTFWGGAFENIHVGDTALLFVNRERDREYSFLLVPVYKDIITTDGDRWDSIYSYYKFSNLIVHPDGTVSCDDNLDVNGSFTSEEVASERYLNNFSNHYQFIEVPLP